MLLLLLSYYYKYKNHFFIEALTGFFYLTLLCYNLLEIAGLTVLLLLVVYGAVDGFYCCAYSYWDFAVVVDYFTRGALIVVDFYY